MDKYELNSNPDTSNFSPRPPILKLWQIAAIMLTEMVIILFSILGGNTTMILAMIALTMITSFLINFLQEKMLDERTASEFQSLTLAEAMRSSTILSIIVRSDAGIYYLDPRYARNFSEGRQYHNLDNVLNVLTIKQPDRKKIFEALESLTPYTLNFRFKRKLGELLGIADLDLQLQVYPLHRPYSYSYIAISHQ